MLSLFKKPPSDIYQKTQDQPTSTDQQTSTVEAIIYLRKLYAIDPEASKIYGMNIYRYKGEFCVHNNFPTYKANQKTYTEYLTLEIYTQEGKFLATKDTTLPTSLLKHKSVSIPFESLRSALELPAYILDCTQHFPRESESILAIRSWSFLHL